VEHKFLSSAAAGGSGDGTGRTEKFLLLFIKFYDDLSDFCILF
jgi:hypothetical protein